MVSQGGGESLRISPNLSESLRISPVPMVCSLSTALPQPQWPPGCNCWHCGEPHPNRADESQLPPPSAPDELEAAVSAGAAQARRQRQVQSELSTELRRARHRLKKQGHAHTAELVRVPLPSSERLRLL